MSGQMIIQALAAGLSLLALLVAAATYVRAGRWKEGDDAKALVAEVKAIDRRLTTVETKIEGLATKSDIAELRAELKAMDKAVEKTAAGVERIEQFMMETGR